MPKEIKNLTIETIKKDLGKVDLIVYSLAAPRRTTPDGVTYRSVLKTTGEEFTNKNLNLKDNSIGMKSIPAATEEEVEATVKVMGGEDWKLWMQALKEAKKHLHQTADEITKEVGVKALISVNKGLVTQASAAIPIVPLYMSVLYKVMKENNVHEGCIEQIERLFKEKRLLADTITDEHGWVRMDDLELRDDIQDEVKKRWEEINTDNVSELADVDGYWEDFYRMFGFKEEGIDYEAETDPVVEIPSIKE